MKYTVKIADRAYEVEIEDIHAHPIIACVDGQIFEVHPENGTRSRTLKEPQPLKIPEPLPPSTSLVGNMNELTAPLPGTVVEIFVKNGEEIETGNIVLIIEAMKMKNSIRATRGGKVADVLVHVGETVAHKQALVRFE